MTGSAANPAQAGALQHANEVHLVGRLAAAPIPRDLPSGDVLLQFRLVVDRGRRLAKPTARRTPTVDTLECAAWRKDVQRALGRCLPGDVVEVRGALRRRFWRSPGGAASRSEVEALQLRRLLRPEPA